MVMAATAIVTGVVLQNITPRASSLTTWPQPIWKQVSLGAHYGIAVTTDGELWSWGDNADGRTGQNTDQGVTTIPTRVGVDVDWVSVSAGTDFALALKSDNTLWVWGNNDKYKTGLGTDAGNTPVPTQVGALAYKSISAGHDHGHAITTGGLLYAWGSNEFAMTGRNTTNGETQTPIQVGSDNDWAMVSAGHVHAAAVKTDGTLWSWGLDTGGRTGQGISGFTSTRIPTQVGVAAIWSVVSCGPEHSAAVQTDGTLWSWGVNVNGRTGHNTVFGITDSPAKVISGADNWTTVSAGENHTIGINGGELWSFGSNSTGEPDMGGQTGLGFVSGDTLVPVQVGSESNWASVSAGLWTSGAVTSGNHFWAFGSGLLADTAIPKQVLLIAKITASITGICGAGASANMRVIDASISGTTVVQFNAGASHIIDNDEASSLVINSTNIGTLITASKPGGSTGYDANISGLEYRAYYTGASKQIIEVEFKNITTMAIAVTADTCQVFKIGGKITGNTGAGAHVNADIDKDISFTAYQEPVELTFNAGSHYKFDGAGALKIGATDITADIYTAENAHLAVPSTIPDVTSYIAYYTDASKQIIKVELMDINALYASQQLVVTAAAVPVTYNITFDTSSLRGATMNPLQYTIETPTFSIGQPGGTMPTGLQFKKWRLDTDSGAVISQITQGSSGDKYLVAIWEDMTFTVTLPINTSDSGYTVAFDGSSSSPVKYDKSYSFRVTLLNGWQNVAPVIKVNNIVQTTNVDFHSGNLYDVTVTNTIANQTITVEGVVRNLYDVTVGHAVTGYSLAVAEPTYSFGSGTVQFESDFKFIISVTEGYEPQTMTVKANGSKLTPLSGVYTISNISAHQSITVSPASLDMYKYAVNLQSGTGYTVSPKDSTSPVTWGQSFSFTVDVDPSHSQSLEGDGISIMVNGSHWAYQTVASANYTITGIKEIKTVTVSGVSTETNSYAINLTPGTGFGYQSIDINPLPATAFHGTNFCFKVVLAAAYSRSPVVVRVDGEAEPLVLIGGMYTISNVTSSKTVSVYSEYISGANNKPLVKNVYEVTFISGEKYGVPGTAISAQGVAHDEKVIMPPVNPTLYGHDFVAWCTGVDLLTEYDFVNATVTIETELFAKWKPKQHWLYFNAGLGFGVPEKMLVDYYGYIQDPGTPTLALYKFEGWWDAGYKNRYDVKTFRMPNHEVTFYAEWAPDTVVLVNAIAHARDAAKPMDKDWYTARSYNDLAAAITVAEGKALSGGLTPEQLVKAADDLYAVVLMLEYNPKKLQDLVNQTYVRKSYTTETYNTYLAARNAAAAYILSEEYKNADLQNGLKWHFERLETTIAALAPNSNATNDKGQLFDLLDLIDGVASGENILYTESSAAKINRGTVETYINDVNIDQKIIDNFIKNCFEQLRANKSKWRNERDEILEDIADIEIFLRYPTDPDKVYTSQSWQALIDAVDALDALLERDNPSVPELQSAITRLSSAASNLTLYIEDLDTKTKISPVLVGGIVAGGILMIGSGLFVILLLSKKRTRIGIEI